MLQAADIFDLVRQLLHGLAQIFETASHYRRFKARGLLDLASQRFNLAHQHQLLVGSIAYAALNVFEATRNPLDRPVKILETR